MIVTDYFSRYLEIIEMNSITGHEVVRKLKSVFARFGIPETLVSDNGPQYVCQEMKDFANECDFRHITSSPHLPQSNGAAESSIQIAKRILRQGNPFDALLIYRATPIAATGASPAQLLMGRNIRTTLPVLNKHLDPAWPDLDKVRENDKKMKAEYKFHYDRRHGVRNLSNLQPGDHVKMKLDNETGWIKSGVVLSPTEQPRSYIVATESGSVMRRNRKHLQHNPIPEEQQNAVPHSSGEQEIVILNKNIPEHVQRLPQSWNTVPLSSQQSVNVVPQSPKPSVVDTSTPKTVNINTKPKRTIKPPDKYGTWTT
jgi:hypothetical protein